MLPITGPNHVPLFKADGELSDLNSKLLLYYTPQVTIRKTHTLYFPVTVCNSSLHVCAFRHLRVRFVWTWHPITFMTAGLQDTE